jgi:hypothetical protein
MRAGAIIGETALSLAKPDATSAIAQAGTLPTGQLRDGSYVAVLTVFVARSTKIAGPSSRYSRDAGLAAQTFDEPVTTAAVIRL